MAKPKSKIGPAPSPKAARRLLSFLDQAGPASAMEIQDKNGIRTLLQGRSSARLLAEPELLKTVMRAQLVKRCQGDGHYSLTELGQSRLRRENSAVKFANDEVSPERGQHGSVRQTVVRMECGQNQTVRIDDHESPLTRLYRTKRPGGGTWLDDAALAAGERLRSDFTHGGLMPRTTSSWNFEGGMSGRASGRGLKADLADSALDARQRVTAALDRVGPELAGVLMDVCCFLKGLESVERERRWPPRSAKLMLRTGLNLLAAHYGTRAGKF
ncbi:MAG: DUF6456 domain-containing protein [Pseudomonadota bacterium]